MKDEDGSPLEDHRPPLQTALRSIVERILTSLDAMKERASAPVLRA
jgi:hypothetical protein